MTKSRSPLYGVIDTLAEMARMREHVLHGSDERSQRTETTAWIPTTDILVRGNDLLVRCELPGVDNDEVEVALSHNTLWITGERTPNSGEDDPDEVGFYVRERHFGFFRRSISLPPGVNASDLHAVFEDGLLEITIDGGAEQSKVERIKIEPREDPDTSVSVRQL